MFMDVAEIKVKSGRGGNGVVAFRREAHVPRGGPAGGDGGNGGNVYLEVDPSKRTLLDFKYKTGYQAVNGRRGGNSTKTGKSGKDLSIPVPPGTVVYDEKTGHELADMTRPGDTLLAARGGKGGRGNARFATATRQAPRFAEMGEKSEEHTLRLELKLIADVGIIGFPNVGKSTLISRISEAKPKIAAYHFTTLVPNLGFVRVDDARSFVVADVPGLIEGAHEGVGLGHEFLRHVERTRMLIHMVDIAGTEGRDPVEDFHIIQRELELHDRRLAELPQVVALNKTDVLQDPELLSGMDQELDRLGLTRFQISAVTGQGIRELVGHVAGILDEIAPVDEFDDEAKESRQFEVPAPDFQRLSVKRLAPNIFMVRGTEVEQLVQLTNLDDADGPDRLHDELDRLGVIDQLDSRGAAPGDTVYLGELEMEYAG